jgi:hypothetical protein
MAHADDPDAALARARQRLARSRQALLEQMRMGGNAQTKPAPGDSHQAGLWPWLLQAWQNHPARLAVQALAPLLRERTRQNPWQVLALSGLLGGALVLLRPWRLLPMGALLMTAARSVPLSQLLSAWLQQAHHDPTASAQAQEQPKKQPQEQPQEQPHEHPREKPQDQAADTGSRRPH